MSELPSDASGRVRAARAYTKRWGGMAAADVDLASVATWDRHLVRDRRVLVPVDVQALVVPTAHPLTATESSPADRPIAPQNASGATSRPLPCLHASP